MMQRTKNEDSPTALRTSCLCVERELSAFARAVEGLFGPEQAQQSIEDWMEELESRDWRSQDMVRDWRRLTIAAATRLARRSAEVVSKQPAKK